MAAPTFPRHVAAREADQALPQYVSDREAMRMFRLSSPTWFSLQKSPDFPRPVWFGPRSKRHDLDRLLAYAESLRTPDAAVETA
jgi:predicted DNA-binding transcriptional regulator AlpA